MLKNGCNQYQLVGIFYMRGCFIFFKRPYFAVNLEAEVSSSTYLMPLLSFYAPWKPLVNPLQKQSSRGVPIKKLFLKISQNSQENTCVKASFFNKVAGLRPTTLLKKRLHLYESMFTLTCAEPPALISNS